MPNTLRTPSEHLCRKAYKSLQGFPILPDQHNYMARIFKFKAWDTKNRQLKRLGTVALTRGELRLENHIILQFTGYVDKLGQEIYEDDILLSKGEERSRVIWSETHNGWRLEYKGDNLEFTEEFAATAIRLCSFYEQLSN